MKVAIVEIEEVLGVLEKECPEWREHVRPVNGRTDQFIVKTFTEGSENEYRVTLGAAVDGVIEVGCVCPPGRQNRLCRHVSAAYGANHNHEAPQTEKAEQQPVPTPVESRAAAESGDEEPKAKMEESGTAPLVPTQPVSIIPAVIELAIPIERLKVRKEQINAVVDQLEKGVDYGTVPGIDRPFLQQPGADFILSAFGCYARLHRIVEHALDLAYKETVTVTEWQTLWRTGQQDKPPDEVMDAKKAEGIGRFKSAGQKSGKKQWLWQEKVIKSIQVQGLCRYVLEADLVHRQTGGVVGYGIGSCSSLERRYVTRPAADIENTIYQIAMKRAKVNAVRSTWALSGRFTQDEDLMANGDVIDIENEDVGNPTPG